MLVTLLVTSSVGYDAPHPYALRISAFVGLVPFAVTLGFSGDRLQMVLSGAILLLVGLLPYMHEKLNRALIDSLAVSRDKAALTSELEVERLRLQETNDALAGEMIERLKAQQAELIAAQKLRMHVERTPLGVIEWDRDYRVTTWNPSAVAIFGFTEEEALGRSATDLIVPASGAVALEAMWRELTVTRDGSKIGMENVTRSGRTINCEWYNTPLVDPGGRIVGFASLVQDVTERLNTERTIHYMAHHDALTGLPNRRLMQDRLHQAIVHARRHQRHVGVLFLDLDRFKLLNDTLGHDSGDQILKDVARRLVACVREVDTVSREGGDEFVVVLPDLEHPENARIVADKILREFARPFDVGGHEVHITTSIGISHYPNDSTDAGNLLKNADSAMYQAKDSGRNTVRFFTSDLNYLLTRRLEVEGRLRRGIEQEEFFLRYQPQVDLASGRIVGMEALIRWNDPDRGEVAPVEFISVAEELGLIVQLGEWVFRTACHQLRAWEEESLGNVVVSVNLSPRQFMSRKLAPSLLEIVEESGVDPRHLEVEITESTVMRDLEQSIDILARLRAVGMGVAIDDFGIGYSSLGQLSRLPATALKIDRSFITNAPAEAPHGSITEAIIAMARSLKLRVVAEGVETRQQLDFLRAHRCDAFQGYIFSRPVTALEASAMLRAQAGGAGWRSTARG
jgi:diguanylate cyclase (GGDEF)-like protein/PAS domain S-box-containing protein